MTFWESFKKAGWFAWFALVLMDCFWMVSFNKQIEYKNQQIAELKANAGKPIHISSLPDEKYGLAHGDSRKFLRTKDGVVGVFSHDFHLNLPEEFLMMGGQVCDVKTMQPIETDSVTIPNPVK